MSAASPGASPAARGGDATPIARELIALALPILASQALRLAFQWIDALWVRGLGVRATAAITTSVFVMWCVYALNDVFGVGLSAYVSQLIGAGERQRAGLAAWKGIRAAFVMGVCAAIGGGFFARDIFRLMDPAGTVVEEGAAYLRVVLLGAPLLMTALSCESVLRAAGDTRTPLRIDALAIALNAVLAPLFIYGAGPVPRMGVVGAALATVFAQGVMFACYVVLAWRRHPSFPLARRAPGPPVHIGGLARVGVPAALISILFSVVYIAFVRSASAHGVAAIAVVGVANRIEAIQFIVSAAIGLAAASILGRSLGAGRPDRAVAVIRTGQRWAFVLATVMSVLFLVVPRFFLAMFTQDPAAFAIGVPYLRILAFAVIPTAIEVVTAEAVIGSGHTTAISVIFSVFSLARIPLAFLVPRWTHSGVLGIAGLISVTCWLRAACILAWVARGTWRGGLAGTLHGESHAAAQAVSHAATHAASHDAAGPPPA